MVIFRIFLIHTFITCAAQAAVKGNWKRHIVWEGLHNNVVVAADFTGDGKTLYALATGLNIAPSNAWLKANVTLLTDSKQSLISAG